MNNSVHSVGQSFFVLVCFSTVERKRKKKKRKNDEYDRITTTVAKNQGNRKRFRNVSE